MKKINLILLIIATILTATSTYFYNTFTIDYKQWAITLACAIIVLLFYIATRNKARTRAAASAIRKSAGTKGLKKFANKLFICGMIAVAAILLITKSYTLLIPAGVALLCYLIYRLTKVRVLLLVSYVATLFCAILFVTQTNIPISSKYLLAYRILSFQIFAFVLFSTGDLYCIDK